MTTSDSPLVPPPPPYTLPESSLTLPHITPNLPEPQSQHSTPLPSYTSSPILHPITPTTANVSSQKSTSSSINHPTSTKSISPITKHIISLTITILGPLFINTLWLTLLNIIGTLFTIIQLPLAIFLAIQFNNPTTTKSSSSNKIQFDTKSKSQNQSWLKHLTQYMWDFHDHLEDAELNPPSHWIK
ncbi:uncharacterized protein UTRI_04467 [Ustilago trichophora]|uniref:Uncharacterized protein n=1 Tax=Ustilago trichophora TaxID=86804 RepID=A0A5C3EHA9_9BASI|nr:uncharacterized protein UTRI_04467 [Ustilago trichophora]